MVLLPVCGVQNGRSRSVLVMEWREMHVISGLRANLGEQCAVDPVYDRSVHFTGSTEQLSVIIEFRHEDVLYLQIPSRMQQRHGVDETFQGTRTEMEALIHDTIADEILEQARLDAHGQRRIEDALDRDVPFFQTNGIPNGPPERNAVLDIAMMDV